MTHEPNVSDWLCLIQSEYREIPGLKLTKPQAQRLWGIDGHICDALLNTLIESHFLAKTANQSYVLADRH
jgi:hypothetical protein